MLIELSYDATHYFDEIDIRESFIYEINYLSICISTKIKEGETEYKSFIYKLIKLILNVET